MRLTDEQLAEFARSLCETNEEELDCQQMLDRAAAFVEAAGTTPDRMPEALRAVAQHLRVCPECREEIEMLLRAGEQA